MKNEVETSEISENKLKELFDACGGRRSHYLMLYDEPKDFIKLLVKGGWITHLSNTGKKPWYAATIQLITKYRDLEKHEQQQLAAIEADELEEARLNAEASERRKNLKL